MYANVGRLIKFLLKKYNFMIAKFRTKVFTRPYKTAKYGVWDCYQIVLPKTQQNRISTHDNSFQSEQSCHGRQIQMKKQ